MFDVEPVVVDPREHLVVGARDRGGLVGRADLLPEHVDRRHAPVGVQLAHDANRVIERRPGDVARGDALHDRAGDSRERANERAVEQAHADSVSRNTSELGRYRPRALIRA